MNGKDVFAQNRRLGRGVNIIGYDQALWQGSDQARMQDKHFRLIAEAGFNHVRINLHPFKHMGDAQSVTSLYDLDSLGTCVAGSQRIENQGARAGTGPA